LVAKKSNTPGVSVFDTGASSRPVQLKKLGIKMLWYPTGMYHISLRTLRSDEPLAAYIVVILPLTIYRIDPHVTDVNLLLGFACLFLFMVSHGSWFSEYT
jgi:hypothetical protein